MNAKRKLKIACSGLLTIIFADPLNKHVNFIMRNKTAEEQSIGIVATKMI